ncbi:CD1375 family protein [Paenibacillus antibioticophila]|nr:CD1375 family protein [Paenibacillus antibioticophila]
MAKIYVDLIQKGLKSIEDVPLRWKEQVQELMDRAN